MSAARDFGDPRPLDALDPVDPADDAAPAPRISIVIPIYNEEAILHAAIVDLRERLAPLGWRYEVVLAENGSRDGTVRVAAELSVKYPEVRSFSMGEPNYGGALRRGIVRYGRFAADVRVIQLLLQAVQRLAIPIASGRTGGRRGAGGSRSICRASSAGRGGYAGGCALRERRWLMNTR